MENEYRVSLEMYGMLRERYNHFLESRKSRTIPPEEEYLTFILDVRTQWHHMYAVDQRSSLRRMTRVVRNLVNIDYRWPMGRRSIHESHNNARQLLEDALDDCAHKDRPWYDLKELEGMATAVGMHSPGTS